MRSSWPRSARRARRVVVQLLQERVVEAPRQPDWHRPRCRRQRDQDLDQPRPVRRGGGRRGEAGQGGEAVAGALEGRQRLAGGARTHPGQELQDPERGDLVARVLGPAQEREHVLDVRRLEEAQPAVLDERDAAPGQLDLEHGAVVGGPEQHGLLAQRHPGLAVARARGRPRGRPGPPRRAPAPAPACARRCGGPRPAPWRAARPRAPSPRWPRPGSAASSGSSAPAGARSRAARTGPGSPGCCARVAPRKE